MKTHVLKLALLVCLGIFTFAACDSEDDDINIAPSDPTAFITTWKTDNPGTTENNQIRIQGTGTNYSIKWENINDSSINGEETATDTHLITVPQPGTYKVSISGGSPAFSHMYFQFGGINNGPDNNKLLEVNQWGAIEWSSMEQAFFFCENVRFTAEDTPDLRYVTNMNAMFEFATNFNEDLSNWDVSNVTNMSFMFINATNFNQDLSNWNVSNVTDCFFFSELSGLDEGNKPNFTNCSE